MSILDVSLLDQVRSLLQERVAPAALRELTGDLQPYDLSVLLNNLAADEQLLLLAALPPGTAAETLEYFEPVEQYRFLDHLEHEITADILNLMPSDAVVELFAALHPRQTEQLFELLQEPFREQIRNQMSYPENSAGSLASVDYIAARRWWTVEQTLSHMRKVQVTAELYNYIYILGPLGELVGVLSLRQLILAEPSTRLEEIMVQKLITVPAELDQEQAAQLVANYDLIALPVISSSGKMAGILTVDDIIDVIEEEATEDIHLLGGSEPVDTPYFKTGLGTFFRKRIVWLLLLFIAQAFTGNILRHYEDLLTQVVALSFFIPLLIGTAGNAGTQTSTMVIRAMSVGEIRAGDFLKVIWRELRLGLALALPMAGITFLRALLLGSSSHLGLTVAATILVIITVSSTLGAIMPIIGKKLSLDPAVFSSPMITTLVDTLGLIIYFHFASMLMGL
ncbi:MAG TPA: magnesium transporter [Bacillota bacterium]|jgi:magnesium transporter|nr:magnesium transporter [Bacillota bacterium]HOA35481.1 magnesium transporter [Bacillota bacterium]HOJ84338.1 magnesium transporter [Bacillota bacterium]HOL16527.1 magnesium transporter [Bacillota bacterium]HPZ12049.1 magnesium transporter [Bacillota bacterium]